jgi:hypothetical protein
MANPIERNLMKVISFAVAHQEYRRRIFGISLDIDICSKQRPRIFSHTTINNVNSIRKTRAKPV